ncbi:metallophosphoesterase family protein [Cohnella terricola]|uniref:Calcineurin-like phosphoesterase domain-containing protein n=1 Tax=Cohnella terricola TaxID=1289167 RepID=A0A559J8S5_9BACL|nr:metallophosphoesterase [Cohnella terricola]TVX96274.1 hypothetical protein FPZ45_21450 [Cohnella terricola]
MSLIRFDLISDIHLDFWVENTSNHSKQDKRLDKFIDNILPDNLSNTLIIAGDIGHYNIQNIRFLEKVKKYYPYILIVPGNHDYYLISKSTKNKYKRNSINRFLEMKTMAEQISGISYLDGNLVEIDGIVYGGCGMWYDFEYGLQQLKADWNRVFDNWKSISNDSVLIEGLPRRVEAMFMKEKAKLMKILNISDVVVTHISPDWSKVPKSKEMDLSNSFYYFNGKEFLSELKGRVWCYGHVHKRTDYLNDGCRLINASLGYPDENNNLPQRIMNVTQTSSRT